MSEQTQLTDEQKTAAAERAQQVREDARIQMDEAGRIETENKWKNLGALSEVEYRKFLRENCGF